MSEQPQPAHGPAPEGVQPTTSPRALAGVGPKLYCAWSAAAIGGSVLISGASPENTTRLLVIAFLLAQLLWLRSFLVRRLAGSSPGARFVLLGVLLAAVVEGLHMISMPVFPSLRVDASLSLADALGRYLLDLLFTLPAYALVFAVIWRTVRRTSIGLWPYILLTGLGQTLGDGGLLYFLGAPHMLPFLPYPMSNYHAMNVIPFLAVQGSLPEGRPRTLRVLLLVPLLVATYLLCGALIMWLGRLCGLAGP